MCSIVQVDQHLMSIWCLWSDLISAKDSFIYNA